MKKGIRWKIAGIVLTLSIIAGCFYAQMDARGAIFDETNAMRFGEYSASNTIEDSMLFIGTYLIHSQSLTEELYQKAQESVETSNQSNVYYKSELADGQWYDITDASGLGDISGNAVAVQETELEDLWVTTYTGSNGITEDIHGNPKNIFEDPNPYDLYNLPELEPIRIQYDNVFSSESEGVDKYYYRVIQEFFKLDLSNSVTDECDEQIESLQGCYEDLNAADKKELAEIVSKLMSRVDARRRAEIFDQLANIDENELNKLQTKCTGEDYDADDYDEQQFVENASVIEAIGSSISNCQESYTEHAGNMLTDGTTVLTEAEYEKLTKVLSLSSGGYSTALEGVLLELKDLYNIIDDVVVNAENELALLEGELLAKGEQKYTEKITKGASGKYQASVANNDSYAIKNQILDEQKTDTNAAREEFQYLIQSKTKRQKADDAVKYTYERITVAEGYKNQILGDEFLQKATETVDAHILWLTDLAKSILGESDELQSDMDKLEAKKEELLLDKAQALDNNDLAGAKKIDAQIAAIDEQIAALQSDLNDILSDPTASAAEKAEAGNSAGASSALNNINNIKNDLLKEIADGNLEDSTNLSNKVDALAALGAEDALKEVKDKLSAAGADNNMLSKVDESIEESKDSSMHGALESDDSVAGDDDAGGISGSAFLQAMEEVFGSDFDGLNDEEKTIVTAVADRLGEEGNTACKNLARQFMNQCIDEKNPNIFQKLSGETLEFLPMQLIGKICGYRYVYSDSRQEVTLTQKAKVFKFKLYSDEMTKRDGSTEDLSKPVKKQEVPYLAEEDASKWFSCTAEYITNTNYGVILNKQMEELAKSFLEVVKEGAQ